MDSFFLSSLHQMQGQPYFPHVRRQTAFHINPRRGKAERQCSICNSPALHPFRVLFRLQPQLCRFCKFRPDDGKSFYRSDRRKIPRLKRHLSETGGKSARQRKQFLLFLRKHPHHIQKHQPIPGMVHQCFSPLSRFRAGKRKTDTGHTHLGRYSPAGNSSDQWSVVSGQ